MVTVGWEIPGAAFTVLQLRLQRDEPSAVLDQHAQFLAESASINPAHRFERNILGQVLAIETQ
jgi:hypothetical protein